MTGYKHSELFELRVSKIVSIEPKNFLKKLASKSLLH